MIATFPVPFAVADVENIRRHFPALARRHAGLPVAYFDGPGGTQVPQSVSDAVTDYLLHHNGNSHWAFPTSVETDDLIATARETLATFLNASPREIVFGANMTTLTFHLARALGRRWGQGDEIIVTELDHHANVAPWTQLEKERGVTVRVARMIPQTGQLDWSDLDRLLSKRTKLLAIGAASNALGTITDIPRATRVAHEAGALVFVDAVHYAPHQLVDVQAFDCDFLACSAYKFYGPHVGILYGREAELTQADFPKLLPAPNSSPDRAETGTSNFEDIAGAVAAVEFLGTLSEGDSLRDRLEQVFAELHLRGQFLVRQLWQGLSAIPRVQIFGPSSEFLRTPTLAFTIAGVPSPEAAAELVHHGIFVSHGDFYARSVADRYRVGPGGFLRAGCASYTTAEEVERLIQAVRQVARF